MKLREHCASVVMVSAVVGYTIILIQILCSDDISKSGILILKFDFTAAFRKAFVGNRALSNKVGNLQSQQKLPGLVAQNQSDATKMTTQTPNTNSMVITTVPYSIETVHSRNCTVKKRALLNAKIRILQPEAGELPALITQVQSEAGAVATQIQSAADGTISALPYGIEAVLPKNCTIGIKQFCVATGQDISCSNLPITISSIFPHESVKPLKDSFKQIESFNTALTNYTGTYIPYMLIGGLVLLVLITLLFLAIIYGKMECFTKIPIKNKAIKAFMYFGLGLICCIPLFIPVIALHLLSSKLNQLPYWIQAQQGNVSKLSIGCLICALVVTITGGVSSVLR